MVKGPAALALLLTAHGAAAQVVRGTVVDAASRTGIPTATIGVIGESQPVRSDDSGRFAMRLSRPGMVVLTVRRLGYLSQTWSFALGAKDTADVVLPLQ